jgi:glyoxylase-like metal-dependent hydrolase (beta-lactamase superfamily II)
MTMSKPATVERIFILDGGLAQVQDGSIYSPGLNVGVPMTLSCNAYLIGHRGGWLLWDTGSQDDLVTEPEGRIVAHGIRGIVRKTLASQLGEIGVRPDEIGTIVLSHAHFDHVGNCRLFPTAKWIAQRAEYDAMFGPSPEDYGYLPELYATMRDNPVEIVEGDHDIFGDGAVRLISTPGHTLGHCSLLVRLESGPVLLSADVAHNRDNFVHRRVPAFNADQEASRASMDKVDALLRAEGATMWVNHDTAQSEKLPHAPRWIA